MHLATRSILSYFALLFAATVSSLAGCDDDEGNDIGGPCETDEDCKSDLACDLHAGQGSCQRPHDHQDASDEAESGNAAF